MRFWFARNSEVPIREQIVTQVVAGDFVRGAEAGRAPAEHARAGAADQAAPEYGERGYRHSSETAGSHQARERRLYPQGKNPSRAASASLALDRLMRTCFDQREDGRAAFPHCIHTFGDGFRCSRPIISGGRA